MASFLAGEADLRGLFSAIPDRAVVLEYFLTNGEIIMFLLSREGILKTERFSMASGFSGACRAALESLDRPYAQRKGLLAYLYDVLIRPLEAAIPASTELIYFAPHGILHYLPFQVFVRTDPKGGDEYLISRYDVAMLMSLAVLGLISSPDRQGITEPGDGTALVIGNPYLGDASMNLPWAASEATQIAAALQTKPHLDADASRRAFFDEAPHAGIITLACHAHPNIAYPLLGYLALSDAPLRVIDIVGLDLKASLLVLSGCHTRVERIAPGDEASGLAQAFFAAGAVHHRLLVGGAGSGVQKAPPPLLSSLQERGLSKARALRLAQLELISSTITDGSGKRLDLSNPHHGRFPCFLEIANSFREVMYGRERDQENGGPPVPY